MKSIYRIFGTLFLSMLLACCGHGSQEKLLDIASMLFQKGKTEEAVKIYDEIITLYPNCKEAYFNKGIILYQQKIYPQAIELFSKAIEVDPMYGKAYLYRGKAYFFQSDLKSAEFDFQSAQIDKETEYDAWLELGMLYVRKKDFIKGLKFLDNCVQKNDTNQIALLSRASALFEMENYRASIVDCNKILHRNQTRWEAFLIKAKNYLILENTDSCKINLEYARTYSNENPQVFAVYSEYYLYIDESAMAASFAEKGLQQQPNNIGLILNRARAFDGMERYDKANEIYLQIEKIADSIPEYHYYLASNLMSLGDSATAVVELTDAIALRPNYSEAYMLRSKLKAKFGDFKGSLEDREKARGKNLWKKETPEAVLPTKS